MGWRFVVLMAMALGAPGASGCAERSYFRLGFEPDSGASPEREGQGWTGGASASAGGRTGSGGNLFDPDLGGSGGAVFASGGATEIPGTGGAGTGGAAQTGGSGEPGGAAAIGGAAGASLGETNGQGGGDAGGAAVLNPRIVSIDFVGTAVPMTPTEVAGVKAAAHWNSAAGTKGTLNMLEDQDGAVVPGLMIRWSANALFHNWDADQPGDARMMNGYLDPMVPATLTVSGIPAAAASKFDVYVYCLGTIGDTDERTYNYAIGATKITAKQRGVSPSSFSGFGKATNSGMGNYVLFQDVPATDFVITATPGTGGTLRAPVNGIQIVLPPGS